jgi:hypothetical protein
VTHLCVPTGLLHLPADVPPEHNGAMQARAGGQGARTVSVLWTCTTLIGIANAVLTLLVWPDLTGTDAYANLGGSVSAVVYATLGVIIVRRVGNRIGWLLLVTGLLTGLMCLTSAYAVLGISTVAGSVPAATLIGAISEWVFAPVFIGVAYVLVIFPTGTLPSPRWRPLAATTLAVTPLVVGVFVVTPRLLALPAPGGVSVQVPNPLAISSVGHGIPLDGGAISLGAFFSVFLAMALVALVVRYRSGAPELRQQIKWVALAAVAGVTCQVAVTLAQAACDCGSSPVIVVAYLTQAAVSLIGIPVAITIAILKYGLYQVDVIINRAVVYTSLTVALAAVYLASVLLLQWFLNPVTTRSDLAVAGSTLAVAALFRPARRRIQHTVDRRFYRSRYDARRTTDDFAARLRHEVDLNAVGRDLRAAVHESLQPSHVTVWLRPSGHP